MWKPSDFQPVMEKVWKSSIKYVNIAKNFKISKSTVYDCINRIKDTGSTNDLVDKQQKQRPKLWNKLEKRFEET